MSEADNRLQDCLRQIEDCLGWGPADRWTTADFTTLGDRIAEKTGVLLSATTLKRVWGRVAYRSTPSPATLDALARFIDYENWRAFASAPTPTTTVPPPESIPAPAPKKRHPATIGLLVLTAVAAVVLLAWTLALPQYCGTPIPSSTTTTEPLDPTDYQFHYEVVSSGLPNSVVFTYDAAAAPVDSIFIQQSWDERRRTQVPRAGNTHTSIYYLPGFYRATLRVGDEEVRSRELLLPSDGWSVAVAGEEVPVYLPENEARTDDRLGVTEAQIEALGLSLQPRPPTVWLSNVGEFSGVATDNFRFRTHLRQTYGKGAAACRMTRVLLLLRNGAIITPLSSPGCTAELNLLANGTYLDGQSNDLSSFGVMSGDWVDLLITGGDDLLSFYLNDELALRLESQGQARDILGIRYEFSGPGEVDDLRLEGPGGRVWEQDLGLGK